MGGKEESRTVTITKRQQGKEIENSGLGSSVV